MTAGQPNLVGIGTGGEPSFGGEDGPVANLARSGGQPATDDLLGPALAIHIGGVDQVATGLDEPVELVVGGGFVGLGSEGHGSQRQRRDTDAARAQCAVFHDEIPFFRGRGLRCDDAPPVMQISAVCRSVSPSHRGGRWWPPGVASMG